MNGIDRYVAKELKTIKDMIQNSKKDLNDYTNMRDDKNESDNTETQNAACELSEEMDIGMSDLENAICEQSEMIEQALSDIENALCELTEE